MSKSLDNLSELLYQYIKRDDQEKKSFKSEIKSLDERLNEISNQMNKVHSFVNSPYFSTNTPQYDEREKKYHEHFVNYIKTGHVSKELIEGKALQGTCNGVGICDESGGYTVSQILNKEIISIAEEANIFRKISRVRQVQGDRNEYLQVTEKIGDLGWVGETDPRDQNTKTPLLEKIVIRLFEMYAQPRVTKNLLINDSALDIYSWLRDEIADAFTVTELNAFLRGKGQKEPLGILSDEAKVQKVTTGVAAKVDFDDILALYESLSAKYREGACFVMSSRMKSLIYTLRDANGNFISQHSFVDKVPDRLFGLPVYVCEALDSGEFSGDLPIIYGNFKLGYAILDCAVNTFIRDDITEKQWVKFYTTKRVGGSVINSEALKILKIT